MSESKWKAKYSQNKTHPSHVPVLQNINWSTVTCISSSTKSSQTTGLLKLLLTLKRPDGEMYTEDLELSQKELKALLDTMADASASLAEIE
eukprot:TRINITY_DN84_c17_g1_i1.p1 TRINITY_DN84_c17_g1~~TRINITY_DN84_c17_g1_i1.p1  ORF type:complete len:107 (+),score=20.61 TRINITY_DN84_c17_g1_i1:49-321(+)